MDMPKRMKFGCFMGPFHRVGENPTLALDRDLELIDWMDSLGFDEAWIGEHHSAGWEIIASPEIFIAADSKYKGMKPDDMKMMSDSLRAAFAEALVEKYQIAASPGPNTLYMRMAFTNVHLKKKGRGLLGYTPVGFVASSAKKALMNDFVDNVLLTEAVWEAEISDSQTGERYGALIVSLGNKDKKREFTSWDQLIQAMEVGSSRIMCRIENSKAEEDELRDCLAEITGM